MRTINKTRYALLGMLLEQPRSGYEIKSMMERSTAYFWRESDSTIYPMLKLLAQEGKVQSEVVYIGKKKKEIFSITKKGKSEFKDWIKSPTCMETQRNEFMLKLFFITEQKEMVRLFQERLESIEQIYEEYKTIEERLKSLSDYPLKNIRIKSLKYGLDHLALEIKWLKDGINNG
jgi:DNA-binding PadR family transcriptional regulator